MTLCHLAYGGNQDLADMAALTDALGLESNVTPFGILRSLATDRSNQDVQVVEDLLLEAFLFLL